ncbi:RidA family protein [Nocardioides sp. R1-1]|uniref:RidA family protein n=1 Tax=Nocardioides sp. R1-1 TaxID=3383502 RepID=UPI0038CF846D
MIEHFERPDGLGPVNGYSHGVAGTGRLLAVSGQLPVDGTGTLVGIDDGLAQARQVFANLTRALGAAGATASDLIRLTYFLTDLADLAAVRTARDEFLGVGPRPASSLVQVAGLVLPGARIEVDALAMLDG